MNDALTSAFVDVWEDKAQGGRSVFVNYMIERFDPESHVCEEVCVPFFCGVDVGSDAGVGLPGFPSEPTEDCPPECLLSFCHYTDYVTEYGWGEVPAEDFRANSQAAQLSTVVGDGDGFVVERCEGSADDYVCTIDEAEPVSIELSWRADGMVSFSNNGTTRETYGDYTYQSHGSYRESSAQLTGNLGDLVFPGEAGRGWLGVSRGGSVQKSVLQGGGGEDLL